MSPAIAQALGAGVASVVPGLLMCVVVAFASLFIEAKTGQPSLIIALVLGLLLHSPEARLSEGLNFSAKRVLEIGIVFLGFRVSFEMVAALGLPLIAVVVGAVTATVVLTTALAMVLRFDPRMGLLAGGATAICGSSACLAIAAALPRDKSVDETAAVVVVGVTLLSTIAMAFYPVIAVYAGLSGAHAGAFLGGSIHNVPQAIGAGYIVSPEAGDAATVVKLLRVMLLMPVTMAVAVVAPLLLQRPAEGPALNTGTMTMLPWFVAAYFAALTASSTGVVPKSWAESLGSLSHYCLLVSVAAIGAKTSVKGLFPSGLKPVALVLLATACLGGLVFSAVASGFVR